VTLPTFAAACHAAAWLLLTAGPLAMQQSINMFWLSGPEQQTHSSSSVLQMDGTDG